MKQVYFILLAVVTLSQCQNKSAHIAQEQVIVGELPDPSIIEVDGIYYATGSSNDWGPIYPIYKSTDLKNWTFINYVFATPPEWTISSYWAPELFYQNGTFYCYYTARRTDGISCIGVATTQNIEEGFEDKGLIIEWGDEAIDAFVFNDDGKLYISWKAYGLTPDRPIQILGSELSPGGLSLSGEAFEILTSDADNWEKGGIEGQCFVKSNGYIYMLYSGNACCGGACDYQVGVARAKKMEGPWEKFEGNPLLQSNDSWKCPGHGTAIQTGGKWHYLYHAYNTKGFPYLGRVSLLSEMFCNDETGWPYFDMDSSTINRTIMTENIVDDFSSGKIENWWHIDIPSYTIKTNIEDGKLTLIEENRIDKNNTGSALCAVPEYADFTMTTKVSEHGESLKGLVFYATYANSVGLGTKGDELILWKVKDSQFVELKKLTLGDREDIFLRADVSDAHIIKFQYSKDGAQWNIIADKQGEDVIGNNLAWWSWGMRAGLFVKTDSVSGYNKAVFDEFLLEYNQ